MQDHDRLFKQLLTVFFEEFIQLFFPKTHGRVDWSSLEFLDKEMFSDQPRKRQVDLLAKVKTHDRGPMVLLIHLEHQAQSQADFPERMFDYFCYLRITYRLPVFPIALFSFASPRRPESGRFRLRLMRSGIVNFRFQVIQLNRLHWRDFINSPNPLASALMAKMQFSVAERPLVKLQCLRLMLSLRLDPDRQNLIANFVNSYLVLSTPETHRLREEYATIDPKEAKAVQEVTNEWTRIGERRGKSIGKKIGKKIGEQLGREEERRKIVLKMHDRGLPIDVIASVTDIGPAEVENIITRAR